MIFYHYVPNKILKDVMEKGIISPYYAYYILNDYNLTEQMLNKYKVRSMIWNYKLDKNDIDKLTLNDIQKALRKFRNHPEGDGYIYALKYKIPKGINNKLDKFIENKVALSFNINDLNIKDIYWGGVNEDFYKNTSEKDYWTKEVTDLVFLNIPHPAILTKEYRILPQHIKIERD